MTDAALAACLLTLSPRGLGGAVVRARGEGHRAWLGQLVAALPEGAPVRRMPLAIADERLLGGLDLSATLAAGRPIAAPGLLDEVAGGVLVVPMAERLPPETAARLAQALDRQEGEQGQGFVLVLLDESAKDEQVPSCLAQRLAFHLDPDDPVAAQGDPAAAEDPVRALCAAADVLGIEGVRAPLFAARAAAAAAQAAGRSVIAIGDVALAARLVLAPRATRLPPEPAPEPEPEPEPEPDRPPEQRSDQESAPSDMPQDAALDPLVDIAIAAARAALPAGLLVAETARAARGGAGGRGAGALRHSPSAGRRAGVRSGAPGRGARLDLLETLKAAAPWQPVRRREWPERSGLIVRSSDFRIRRFVRRAESTVIFVVDASGSAALARMNEAKGAVELLLATSYVRRDEAALIAFRREAADLLLPPTRSLARAKRCLRELPGGGGTPMAAAIDAAAQLAASVAARGRSVTLMFLSDGRANVARRPDVAPMDDAEAAARRLAAMGHSSIFIDTSARPRAEAARLAAAMRARLVPLPRAGAAALAAAVG